MLLDQLSFYGFFFYKAVQREWTMMPHQCILGVCMCLCPFCVSIWVYVTEMYAVTKGLL